MSEDNKGLSEEFTEEEKELLGDLELKHKKVFPLRVKDIGLLVLRRPTRSEWRRYLTDLKRPGVDEFVLDDNLTKLLTVYPNPEAIDAVLDEYPRMASIFKTIIESLATGDNTEVAALGKDWKEPSTA